MKFGLLLRPVWFVEADTRFVLYDQYAKERTLFLNNLTTYTFDLGLPLDA